MTSQLIYIGSMFTRIDRYIARLFLTYFIAGLVVFVTIFLAVDVMTTALRHSGVGVEVWLRYYGYFLPTVVYQMIPVACLLATVFTLSTLNKANELVALFSMGMGLLRVSAPILTLVGLVSAFSFFMSDSLLPRLIQKKNYVDYVEIQKRPGLYSMVNTNKIWYRSENILFNIKTLDTQNARAQGLTLYYFDAAWNLVQLVTARDVNIDGRQWRLTDGSVTLFEEKSSFPLTQSFQEKILTMNEDMAEIQSSANSAEIMSLTDLKRFIHRNKEAGLDTLRYEVDYYAKFGFASAALVMSLLGIPFSVRRQRSGGSVISVGICLGLAFAYWVLYSSGVTLGQHGAVAPVVAAWGPSALMGGVGLFLIRRLRQ